MMTLTQRKVVIRRARTLMHDLRTQVNERMSTHGFTAVPSAIHLSQDDFEILEWGMGHLLKQWVPELDAEQEVIPGKGKLIRMRGNYARNDGTDNFLFKGIPVRCADPVGVQA